MKKFPFILTIGLISSYILAACGRPTGPSKTLDVTMTDFTFSPNTFTVPAGVDITFKATNNGAVAHSFIIMKSGYKVTGHFTDADKSYIYWEVEQITPGQSINKIFTSPSDPGQYQIVCGVSGHFEAGMVANLIVVK